MALVLMKILPFRPALLLHHLQLHQNKSEHTPPMPKPPLPKSPPSLNRESGVFRKKLVLPRLAVSSQSGMMTHITSNVTRLTVMQMKKAKADIPAEMVSLVCTA